ncbi:advillin isoform X2 [Hydra vulgaris]|uniref:Advillin isoform X2 n=1 Tax=Hydra vulgaris TaxID=6087 RepID=A0ABM4C443_HYDVU
MQVAGHNTRQSRKGDVVFTDAGKTPGLTIWRVEDFGLKKVEITEVPVFYNGDSYVVLKCEGKSPPYSCHIHFWLGKKTSQDEAGTAALKSVELDDLLGGSPTQYREIQQHESRKFLSYFPLGIKYEEGGVRSGFKHIETKKIKRLMQIKGRKRPRVFEVPCHCDSLNHGDVFILDNGGCIWVWCGKESSEAEKRKGMEVAQALRDEGRAGTGISANDTRIIVVDDDPSMHPAKASKNDPLALFFEHLGSFGHIKPSGGKSSDELVEREKMKFITLHRVKITDSAGNGMHGQLRVIEEATGDLKYSMLDNDDTFVLDNGGISLWVWVGKNSSNEEKLQGMKVAVNFLRSKGYPDYTQVVMVKQGSETPAFKQCFIDWPIKPLDPQQVTFVSGRGIAKSIPQMAIDTSKLHLQQKRQEEKMIDDGRGKVDVWRVENFKLIPVPKEATGVFFGGDCYVILYTYVVDRKECYLIYYWLGLKSTPDEKGTAAAMTVKMDESLGGAAVQVRVVQGKEPLHFLKIFNNKMIVYRGGKASGFRGHQQELQESGFPRLFQVRGQTIKKALEVEPCAASLNSNDVFVLVSQKNGYLWYGKGCIGDERELAKELAFRVAPRYSNDFVVIPEGKEPKEFWDLLGGIGEYSSGSIFQEAIPEYPPRLFLCSTASGKFEVEELFNFTQNDLDVNDVMILDTHDTVFIWLGNQCTETERKLASKTAMDYVNTDPSGRDPEKVQKLVVKQGFEPLNFTGCFPAWDSTVFSHGKSYERLKQELNNKFAGIIMVDEYIKEFSLDRKLPLSALQTNNVPNGVDPRRKEYYLTPEEFLSTFGMTLAQYDQLPQWKKDEKKKSVKLF